MKYWLVTFLSLLWATCAVAGAPIFPPAFEGLVVSKDSVHMIETSKGWVLVSIQVDPPEDAKPLDGYREDMWTSGQLNYGKIGSITGLTPEQAYLTTFCFINKAALGLQCKNTQEVRTASTNVPWLIPVAVVAKEEAQKFTELVTRGPIPASLTRVAGTVRSPQNNQVPLGSMIPWSDGGVPKVVAPPEMEWYSGPIPKNLRRD